MDIAYHRYGLPLRGTAGGNARSGRRVLEGFLIRVNGGYGCVQPWPELGDGTLEQQWQAIKSGGRTRLLGRALEGAAADAAARREGRSLFEGLVVPRSHATVTGAADFTDLKAEGFTTVKLKGGRDTGEVLGRMKAAVAAGLRVRVDFNGTLDEQGFRDFGQAAEDVRKWVDFVEDPLPYVAEKWEQLRGETGWRLALDWVRDGVALAGGFDVRVLKPAADRLGASGTRQELRPPVVVTSYMDHPLGQAFAAWEAGRYAGEQRLAGLLTHRLFEPDAFTERLAVAGPDWLSPGGTGLGFDDLLEKLPWISLTDDRMPRAGRVLQNPRDPLPGGGPVLEVGQVGFSTSGSTGVPSVVVHTRETLEASARAVNGWLGAAALDVWLRVLPDFHVGGYQIGVRAGLSGSRVVVDPGKWEAGRFVETCREEAVTLTSLVPAQVVDLVRSGHPAPAGLRAVVVGGGALDVMVLDEAVQLGWPVLSSYGATEAGSQVATVRLTGGSRGREAGDPESGPTGMMELLPCWEGRTVPDGGQDGAGLLELRGPALAMGRFLQAGAHWTWRPLRDPDGWWRTSDRVVLSGRHLRFAGRADRVVKVLGELVSLEAVERALGAAGLDPGSFVVVAVPEERRGRELVLVMEARGNEVGRALDSYAARSAPFARLGRIIPVAELPRSPLGKIRYAAAADLVPPRAVPG